MSVILALEHPFVKVPYESVNKSFRTSQKVLEKEVSVAAAGLSELVRKPPDELSKVVAGLDAVANRLRDAKRKVSESLKDEERYLRRCKLRLTHLREYPEARKARDEASSTAATAAATAATAAAAATAPATPAAAPAGVDAAATGAADMVVGVVSDSVAQELLSEARQKWQRKRLDRILVDYLLRSGFYETARGLADDSAIGELVNLEVFEASLSVEAGLRERRECAAALAWCGDNRARLRKVSSTLEFNLRVQEFIELVRRRRRMDAVAYAKKYMAPWADTNLKQIRTAMGLLAYPPGGGGSGGGGGHGDDCGSDGSGAVAMDLGGEGEGEGEGEVRMPSVPCPPVYTALYSDERWEQLARQFRMDNFLLNSLTSESLLSVTLQAGLTALKTPACYREHGEEEEEESVTGAAAAADGGADANPNPNAAAPERRRNVNCPVCSAKLRVLGEGVPYSRRVQSCLVCRASGVIMNEDNPPLALPNGRVYSQAAMDESAAQNGGMVVCPRTGEHFNRSSCSKVFVL